MGSVNLPFDRHDWWVDRCGKEVRYTIDYYYAAGARTVHDAIAHAHRRALVHD